MSNNNLTHQEVCVLQAMSQGLETKEIAQYMGLSPRTVKNYTSNIFIKLGAKNRTHCVRLGIETGYLIIHSEVRGSSIERGEFPG